MKTRSGFVSNSSSSSFIIISDSGDWEERGIFKGEHLSLDSSLGESEFGWMVTEYKYWADKVNFCYLQCLYSENKEWLGMLSNVIQEYTGCESIYYGITTDYYDDEKEMGYIDHQSAFPDNTQMFDSAETLTEFIFSKSSYIQGGNDNG